MRKWPYAIVLSDAVIMHGGPGLTLSIDDISELAAKERGAVEPAPDGYHMPHRKEDIILWDREYFRCAEYDEISLRQP